MNAEKEFPAELFLREINMYEALSDSKQRIYTTAGQEYQKVKYIRADLVKTVQDPNEACYIQAVNKTVGNCMSWWRDQGKGYTTVLTEAAEYSYKEASRILARMQENRSSEIARIWPAAYINTCTNQTVDVQRVDITKVLP